MKSQIFVFKGKLTWIPPDLKLTAAKLLRLQWGGAEPALSWPPLLLLHPKQGPKPLSGCSFSHFIQG